MKFQFEFNSRTFEVSTRTDKNATSNYDTRLNVSEKNIVVAGRLIRLRMFPNVIINHRFNVVYLKLPPVFVF